MQEFLSTAKKKFLSATLAAGIFFCGNVADAASADDFRDVEYFGSEGLDLVNAADAYAKGFTGKGITIGVLDQPINFLHPKIFRKNLLRRHT